MTSSLFLIPRPFLSEKEGRQRREEEADILARESLLWVSVDFGLERQNADQTVTVRGVGRGHRGHPYRAFHQCRDTAFYPNELLRCPLSSDHTESEFKGLCVQEPQKPPIPSKHDETPHVHTRPRATPSRHSVVCMGQCFVLFTAILLAPGWCLETSEAAFMFAEPMMLETHHWFSKHNDDK